MWSEDSWLQEHAGKTLNNEPENFESGDEDDKNNHVNKEDNDDAVKHPPPPSSSFSSLNFPEISSPLSFSASLLHVLSQYNTSR